MTYANFQTELVDRKWRFRFCRQSAREVLAAVVVEWQPWHDKNKDYMRTAFRRGVRERLEDKGVHVGSMLLFFLLSTIIKLVWIWWLNRDKAKRDGLLRGMKVDLRKESP